MPRVKPLIRPDPSEQKILSEIGAGMMQMQLNQQDLARLSGINPNTLSKRIGKGGDIRTLRLGEMIAIRGVFKKGGVYHEEGTVT